MLPNLIIIGAQKCGTTRLHYYLGLHPQIFMSKEKELEFFIEERNWPNGLAWYASNFKGRAKIYGESSPNYSYYPRFTGVPARMHAIEPKAKLIYIVRDPIERMISSYIQNCSGGRENRSIEEALRSPNNQYRYRSLYYMQLMQYLAHYPASQIVVITNEDLECNLPSTLRKVFEFLDVDPDFCSRWYALRRHSTARKRRKTGIGMRLTQTPPMKLLRRIPLRLRWPIEDLLYFPFSRKIGRPVLDDSLRQELIDYLRDDINRLREFTGNNFENWCLEFY